MASPSDKAAAGALIPQFQLSRVLNQGDPATPHTLTPY